MLPMTHFFLYSNIFHGYKWDFPYDSRLEMGDILPEKLELVGDPPQRWWASKEFGVPF